MLRELERCRKYKSLEMSDIPLNFTLVENAPGEVLWENRTLHMHQPLPPSPSLLSCRCHPAPYIHHSFINSENSSLVNCLGKFNSKRKLLKEKDIIKLQGWVLDGAGACGGGRSRLSGGVCAPCQKSHTAMFKAGCYIKLPPFHALHQTLCPCLALLKVPERTRR